MRLAKILIENPMFKNAAGEVLFIATSVQCYFEPLQSTIPFHLEGEGEPSTANYSATQIYKVHLQ